MKLPVLSNNERLWLWALGGMLVAYFLWRYFIRKPEGNAIAEDPNLPPPRQGFDALNEAIAIHDALAQTDVGCRDKEEAFSRILDYSHNELVGVVNAYRKTYSVDDYPTLRRIVEAEYYWYYCTGDLKGKVLQRLTAIGS